MAYRGSYSKETRHCNSGTNCLFVYIIDCLFTLLRFLATEFVSTNQVGVYQPMTHICVINSHKPIIIYTGGLILGVNTMYFVQAFFKVRKWLKH